MLSLFSRYVPSCYRNLLPNGACNIHTSSQLWAEPMRKRRRMDPALLKMREQRKIRKLEKGIRQLKKHAKKMKPIDEMEVSPKLQRELADRKRQLPDLPPNIVSFRQDLIRVWSRVQSAYYKDETKIISAMLHCQNAALEDLKEADPGLYDAAMQPDLSLIPFKIDAVTETPPLKNYQPPDGKYTETTKKWRP
ncbi:39S ribosomal protein L40, mitochondrial [Galendromus occidentalis]|uniref:Large ribosomal subunit protein mL40 n=1 Tax=Galendromus occidentalis TaxID=34638 RepID=A0AAJ6QUI6_9ACAR|nr:39S ribosomal protein L40, mitochondrial [Galendromus occidentalis]